MNFYFIITCCDCGVCMLIRILLLSNGYEANGYEQIHVDVHRKVLVLQLAEHLFEVKLNVFDDENEENGSDETQEFFLLPKKP